MSATDRYQSVRGAYDKHAAMWWPGVGADQARMILALRSIKPAEMTGKRLGEALAPMGMRPVWSSARYGNAVLRVVGLEGEEVGRGEGRDHFAAVADLAQRSGAWGKWTKTSGED